MNDRPWTPRAEHMVRIKHHLEKHDEATTAELKAVADLPEWRNPDTITQTLVRVWKSGALERAIVRLSGSQGAWRTSVWRLV